MGAMPDGGFLFFFLVTAGAGYFFLDGVLSSKLARTLNCWGTPNVGLYLLVLTESLRWADRKTRTHPRQWGSTSPAGAEMTIPVRLHEVGKAQ